MNHALNHKVVCLFIASSTIDTICQLTHSKTLRIASTSICILPRCTAIVSPRSFGSVNPSISYWFLFTDRTVRISSQCVPNLQTISQPIMPPACSLLGIASPTPPEIQPFRFFELPIEIRYMVYDLLKDRGVPVTIPGLELPSCVYEASSEVIDCFRPAMLRVNKQLANEYAALVMPRMILLTNWRTCDHDTSHEEISSDHARSSTLPERTLASLQYVILRIIMNTSTSHCGTWRMLNFGLLRLLMCDVQKFSLLFGA